MKGLSERVGPRTALAAAFLLFFQGLLSAHALGASAAAAPLDAFGNPICHADAGYARPGSGHAPGHAKLPLCCTLGCPLLSAPHGPAPDLAVAAPPRLIDLAAPWRPAHPLFLPGPEHRPGSPRAPPAAV